MKYYYVITCRVWSDLHKGYLLHKRYAFDQWHFDKYTKNVSYDFLVETKRYE